MWFRTGVATLTLLALAVFVALSGALLWLFVDRLGALLGGGGAGGSLRTLALAATVVFAGALLLAVAQIAVEVVTRDPARAERTRDWATRYSDALLSDAELPDPAGDPAARAALLELRDTLYGPYGEAVVEAYERFGFLAADLRALSRSFRDASTIPERIEAIFWPPIASGDFSRG